MRFRFLALPVAAVLLAAGCTPGNGTPTPTPTPSVSSVASPTSTPSSTPTPSSEDALYAEAERVYRAALEAQWKFELTGDYSEFPPELAEYYGPEFLEELKAAFEVAKEQGLRLTGGVPVVEIGPIPGAGKDASEVAIQVCYDGRGLVAVDAEGAVLNQGELLREIAYLKSYDGQLKIFDSELAKVDQCSVG